MFRAGSWSLRGQEMQFRSFRNNRRKHANTSKRDVSSNAGKAANAASASSSMNPVLKSALISGTLSLAGDLVAQLLTGATPSSYDAPRAARMGSFGLVFYGPYQHYWYAALDRAFNAKDHQELCHQECS